MIVKRNVSLKPFNTFHLDVNANFFAEVNSVIEVQQLISENQFLKVPKFVLGGGSNILLTKNIDGIVMSNNIMGIEKVDENDKQIMIRSGAGVTWNDLVMYCVERNYGGIENLSLIPGKVGAAPIQNIGAYGVELKETFHELEAVNLATGEIKKFGLADCKFGYRDSVFKNELKNQFMITNVTLKLSKHPVFNTSYGAIETELAAMGIKEKSIRAISDAVCNIRRSKLPDPAVIGNAGSFFKNPEVSKEKYESLKKDFSELVAYKTSGDKMKLAAGWMIEQCGWKGKVSGHVGMHNKQSLVLVNYGDATGNELYEHAKKVQESVVEKFGVLLEMEVNIV